MRDLYKKYKREIWVGVVVSIMTTAIIKFSEWFFAIAPSIGSSIFETTVNVLYSFAATFTDGFLLRIILFGGLSLMAGASFSTIQKGMKIYKSTITLEKKFKSIPEEKLNEIVAEKMLEEDAEKTKSQPERIPTLIQQGKRIGKKSLAVIILTAVVFVLLIFTISIPMQLHNSFEQDLVKIAPYVEENTITQLKSDWVCMRSEAEYEEIYVTINNIKAEYSLP